jgi:hypothetical protein
MCLTALAAGCSSSAPSTARLRAIAGENLPATANNSVDPIAFNSPGLAIDPTEPRFVAMAHRVDSPDFSCGLQVSGDGGRRFGPANPIPTLPEGVEKCYAPEVDFDRKGNLYFLFVGLHTLGNTPLGVYLTISTDRARTFSIPRQVLGPSNFGVRMAIDRSSGSRGRIHLAWLAANTDPGIGSLPTPPNPVMSSYSDDGGRTFSKPLQVSDPRRQLVVAPFMALGPGHRVSVGYYDLGADQRDYHGLEGPTWDEPWSIVVATSTNGGRTFSTGSLVDDHVVPTERVLLIFTMPPPSMVIDRKGHIVVAWHDARNGDWDVFTRSSTDGGRTWSVARRVNDDPTGNGASRLPPTGGWTRSSTTAATTPTTS